MDELQAQIEAHNARQLQDEIELHLQEATEAIERARYCLEDLAVYLPRTADQPA